MSCTPFREAENAFAQIGKGLSEGRKAIRAEPLILINRVNL